jgi:hypothetical protein
MLPVGFSAIWNVLEALDCPNSLTLFQVMQNSPAAVLRSANTPPGEV